MTTSSPKLIATAAELSDLVSAYWPSRAVLTAMELNLFAALAEGPLTASELAARLGTDPRGTDLLANAIAALGLLDKSEGRFALTDWVAEHLVRGGGDYLGGLIEHHFRLWRGWSRLTDVVRAGQPVQALGPPAPAPEFADRDTRSFIWGMHTMGSYRAKQLADALHLGPSSLGPQASRLPPLQRIADIGGGPGDNAYELLKRLPEATAVIFDLPDVVPIALEIAAAEGVADRVEGKPGDFMVDDFPPQTDLVLMSQIMHSNTVQTCQMLCRKAFASLDPGGRCVIHEFVLNDDAASPAGPALFSLNMLLGTPGRSYTDSELRSWLTAAGFTDIESRPVDPDVTALVTGRKAGW